MRRAVQRWMTKGHVDPPRGTGTSVLMAPGHRHHHLQEVEGGSPATHNPHSTHTVIHSQPASSSSLHAVAPLPPSLQSMFRGKRRTPTISVVYNLNDMRVHDHYPLALACAEAKRRGVPLIAIMCLDVRMFAQPSMILGCYRQGPVRANFTLQCVASLRDELAARGVPLLIRQGFPEVIVPQLLSETASVGAYLTTQYAPHEKVVHDEICRATEQLGIATSSVWHTTLVHLDDWPTPMPASMRDGFRWFHEDALQVMVRPTRPYDCSESLKALPSLLHPFQLAERDLKLHPHTTLDDEGRGERAPYRGGWAALGDVPTLQDLGYPEKCSEELIPTTVIATQSGHTGGEQHASSHVEDWLSQGGMKELIRLGRVKRSSVHMYSQQLLRVSPYLSTGCLSPRTLYERVREHAIDHATDGAVHTQYHELLLRLLKRDYWHLKGMQYGPTLFYSYGPSPEDTDEVADFRFDEKLVQKWCHALTGFPFADASMKELTTTGWVAEPGRQALMWLLTQGLHQDWRAGAEWFERCSLDYDPWVCWGNAAYTAGLLRDDFGDAVFPLHYLAHKHDQTGIYVKKWLPQLSKVPSVYIHRPHVMSAKMQAMHHVFLGRSYPYPVKLWDGAQHSLGSSELTAYFDEKQRSQLPDWEFKPQRYGACEAYLHGRDGSILDAANRSLTVSKERFDGVEQRAAALALAMETTDARHAEYEMVSVGSSHARQPSPLRLSMQEEVHQESQSL